MKKFLFFMLSFLISTLKLSAQQEAFNMDLWPNGLPNSNGIDQSQPYDDSKQNFKPSIRVFLPDADKATGLAVVCCPGGGYSHLAMDHEGYEWASFFNERGIALIVLKYRMPHANPDVPISDAKEALRVVRENAQKWNIDPQKVGIMGSSAGGHLASTVSTHSDMLTAPAFQILFYPVVTFDYKYTHQGSRHNLIGKNAAGIHSLMPYLISFSSGVALKSPATMEGRLFANITLLMCCTCAMRASAWRSRCVLPTQIWSPLSNSTIAINSERCS